MAYLKINDIDFSLYVNKLDVKTTTNYNAQTNAAGDTVVDYINNKKTVTVGVIPLDDAAMANLQEIIGLFNVSVTYLNPQTRALESINCIIPENKIEYYTIQSGKVQFNAFTMDFIEL